MLCSRCNKNTAVVFVNRLDENKQQQMEGLCYNCAKELGINPLEALAKQANLSQTDLEDMTSQFETMFKDISDNLSEEELNNLMTDSEEAMEDMNPDSLGSIFSGLFGFKNNSNDDSTDTDSEASQKSDKTTFFPGKWSSASVNCFHVGKSYCRAFGVTFSFSNINFLIFFIFRFVSLSNNNFKIWYIALLYLYYIYRVHLWDSLRISFRIHYYIRRIIVSRHSFNI